MLEAQRRANLKCNPARERRGRESYALAAAVYSDLSMPTTCSPISPFRGEHSKVAGGRVVASRRPSSAPIAPARSSLVQNAGHEASNLQDSGSAPAEDRQGIEFSRRRREGTAHRRRVLMGIAQPGDDLATDPITLEDENQRLKVELHRATEERRKSRVQRMRLESELLRAEGKVEALLVELKYAPRNRNIRLLNAIRRDVEKCGVIRTLAKQNNELQELLSRQEKEMKVLKRTQEWSAVTEMTAAMEEYVVEIQRLYRLLARHNGTTDVRGIPTKNTGNETRSKLNPSECVDVADLGQSSVPRRANKNHGMEHNGSDQNIGRCRRRVGCFTNSNVWRVHSRITADPTAVETSTNHRGASRVVIDENKSAADDEVERRQHYERSQQPVGGINTAQDGSIRGSGTPHAQVPQRGQNRGRITSARSGSSLHFTKKSARPARTRVTLRSAVCTSPAYLSRPSSHLDGSDGGVEETPATCVLQSQVSKQIELPEPRRGSVRSKRRRNRPLSAPPKGRKNDQEYGQPSALLQRRRQAPRVCHSGHPQAVSSDATKSHRKSWSALQHSKNLRARITNRLRGATSGSTARRPQILIVPEIQAVDMNTATGVDPAAVRFCQIEGQRTPARTPNTTTTATTSSTEHERKRRKRRLRKTGSDVGDREADCCSEALLQEENPLHQESEPHNHDNLMVVPRCDEDTNGEARPEEEPVEGGRGNTNGVAALETVIEPSSESNSLGEKQTSGLVSPTAASSGSDKLSTLGDGVSVPAFRHEERPEPGSVEEESPAGGSTPKSLKNSAHGSNVDASALVEDECQAGDVEECYGAGDVAPKCNTETYFPNESETGTAEYGDDFDEDEERSRTS